MAKNILNNIEITGRIVDIMQRFEITKYALAQQIGIDRSALTKIFSGKQNWTLDILYNIATEFNVSLDYLVTGKEQNEELHKKIKSLEESSERLRNNLLTQLEINKEYVLKQTDK